MAEVAQLDVATVIGADQPPTREELLRDVRGAAAAIVTLTERIDAEFFDAAGPQLKVVANVAVGYDNIDVAEATGRGVIVTNTPGVLDDATADHTFAMILGIARRVAEADRFARSGTPWVWGPRMLVGLDVSAGASLGIVGYGRIGRAVAQRARAFGMQILVHDARPIDDPEPDLRIVDLPTLLAESDVVSLHVPLLPQTRHLIDGAAIEQMKPGAYLINAARGGVVDEAALIAALRSGRLAGAALDTFEGEPQINPELIALENTLLQPHIASAGAKTRDAMCRLAVRNVRQVLAGEPAQTPVPTT
jgi:lactate dehydrogenase-like 2-hydroxyacid dehydrogenase